MESKSTVHARALRLSVYLVALALVGTALANAARDYGSTGLRASAVVLPPSTTGNSAIDSVTGYPSGSAKDQQIRAFLKQSGYEGGGAAVQVVDPVTGFLIGSSEDERIRAFLEQSGYEGGGTVVVGALLQVEN